MRNPFVLASPLCLFLLHATSALAQENESGAPGSEPSRWETGHSIMVGGETVQYDAVVPSTTLTGEDGEPAAELFYTAYFRRNGGPSAERPLVFAYNEDARSLAQFVRRFLSEYERWNSPRYLLGESYGTTRSAVLAGHLQRADFAAGHMTYVEQSLLAQWKETLDDFILRTTGRPAPATQ